jgi:predicted nucleic acid-binding protein
LAQAAQMKPPILTCEPVVSEALHLLRGAPHARTAIVTMLESEVLQVQFSMQEHLGRIGALIRRYADIPMSLADACLVCMSELAGESAGPVCTIDSDFRIYRRNRRQRIPVLMPPGR